MAPDARRRLVRLEVVPYLARPVTSLTQIVVVGASLAGLRAVEALRRLGFDGRITWIGAERHLPYDRPPLSKDVLAGTREPARIALRDPDSYDELAVELRLGRRATRLDLAARTLYLDDGARVGFDGLVIATGSCARTLKGALPRAGVHLLRTLDDALALRDALDAGPRVAIVGAGFIGAEVAATCRTRGLEVTMIEPLATPLLRGIGAELGARVAALHRDHGVDLRCGVGVEAIEGGARVEALRLSDGARVPADVVLVGIGAAPETAWLEGSGLRLEDGVVCDSACRAAPGVVAAGDVARWHNVVYDDSMRVEHWTNAVEQAGHAAATLLAGDGAEPYAHVPYVWTDQYEMRLQIAGHPQPGDATRIVEGTPEEGRFVTLFGRGGRLVAAVGFQRARQVNAWRRRIATGTRFDDAVALGAGTSGAVAG